MICNDHCRRPWEERLFMCSCLPNFLRGGRHKKTDSELDQEERTRRGIASYEGGGPKYTNLIDDGRSIGFFEQPVRVGGSILLCGQRDSHFPYQCMMGPDWCCSVIVYALIIVVHITVLSLAVPCMGWIVLFMGLFGFLFLLYIYSAVACSNPGMVLKMAPDDYNIYHQTEEERFQRMQELAETGQLDYVNADVAADVHVEAGESEHENGKGKETDGHHDEEVEDVEAEARAITIAMTSVAGVCVNVDEGKDVDVVVGIGETGTGANAGEETTIRHMRVHDDDNESSDDSFNNASQHRASQALLWKHNAGNISTNLGINSNGTTSDTSTSDCKTSNNGNGEVNIVGTGTTIESISGNNINVVNTGSVYDREVPCGHCQFSRPIQARHCTYCGCCIEGLDHHCPWSGKCIGNNNIRAFHWFVGFVCFEIYFMGGIFVYYLAACKFDASIPTSPIT